MLGFTPIAVFNSKSLSPTFVRYSRVEIYADLFIHVTLDRLSGGPRVAVLFLASHYEYSFRCLSITIRLGPLLSLWKTLYFSV